MSRELWNYRTEHHHPSQHPVPIFHALGAPKSGPNSTKNSSTTQDRVPSMSGDINDADGPNPSKGKQRSNRR